MIGDSPPVSDAKVTLGCCGVVKTNAKGEFLFESLGPGRYNLRVSHVGFYPLEEPDFEVKEGRELIYYPLRLERCVNGNCDSKLRPKRPPNICE